MLQTMGMGPRKVITPGNRIIDTADCMLCCFFTYGKEFSLFVKEKGFDITFYIDMYVLFYAHPIQGNNVKSHKRYRIAMVAACPFPTSQGSQVFIRQLAESLAGHGHKVSIVTYHFGEEGLTAPLDIHRIPRLVPYKKLTAGPAWKKPLLDVLLTGKLFQIVKKHNIEIIHAHNYEAALSGAVVGFCTGIPVLFHAHGVMEDELHTYFRGRFSRFAARHVGTLLDIIASRWTDSIIALNPEGESFFVSKGIARGTVTHIPPGISYQEASDMADKNVCKAHGIDSGPMVLYTGNIDGYQNLELLFESFVLVLEHIPDARLVLLTHGKTDSFAGLCSNLGIDRSVYLITIDSFTQVQHFLARALVAVMPRTSWSGFPIKLLNYMASGTPVVACEGSSQCIEHGRDGLIVKNNDREAFARSIISLIQDPCLGKKLGQKAREKVRMNYAWDCIIPKIEKMYDAVSRKKQPTGPPGITGA